MSNKYVITHQWDGYKDEILTVYYIFTEKERAITFAEGRRKDLGSGCIVRVYKLIEEETD